MTEPSTGLLEIFAVYYRYSAGDAVYYRYLAGVNDEALAEWLSKWKKRNIIGETSMKKYERATAQANDPNWEKSNLKIIMWVIIHFWPLIALPILSTFTPFLTVLLALGPLMIIQAVLFFMAIVDFAIIQLVIFEKAITQSGSE